MMDARELDDLDGLVPDHDYRDPDVDLDAIMDNETDTYIPPEDQGWAWAYDEEDEDYDDPDYDAVADWETDRGSEEPDEA